MVNSDDFAKRLQKVIEYYSLTASSFADAIDFNRSSISHLLSGRNKPSLEFVLKVLQKFPEVKLYWLMNGTGKFPDSILEVQEDANKLKTNQEPSPSRFEVENFPIADKEMQKMESFQNHKNSENGLIEKIIIFYKNGTFKLYEN
ncbi:MAG: hypothetical protein AUK33_10770 [Flavobacteriaceae bacterium CG2_30_34_30]|nr:MAG: hypothetical protein AUK33_10770 [Flavobacteriaceae bacterium CG2_30_34_30]